MAAISKNVVFDVVGTCVLYDKPIEALDKQLGAKLSAEGVKPSILIYMWLEAAEREYTYLSITGRYIAFDKVFASLFYRMLWTSGIENPRKFANHEDLRYITAGYMDLEVRPDLKECFSKLRAVGFTVRGLTAGDLQRVAGYFQKAGVDMPSERLMSCGSFGIGKPDLKSYESIYEELRGGSGTWFAAAPMWDVSSAKQIG
jgi:2-haloacid dehalogenase